MIMGVISGGNVQHHALARLVESTTQSAAVKRIERFFKQEKVPVEVYAIAIVAILNFTGKFQLRLDRTNWKFGIKNINYLVLSWQISDQISLPLLFVELDKAGNSNTAERQDLIELFVRLFGADRIAELSADREFVGEKWIKYLIEKDIPFFIRTKENMKVPWGKKPCSIKAFLQNWDDEKTRLIEKDMYGSTVYFACKKIRDGELLFVMTNQKLPANQILDIYKKRWSIETLFKNLKLAGFNWENTHMTDPDRLVTLLIIMGIASLFVYLIGDKQAVPFRKTVGCPLRSCFRSGIQQFQYLMSQFLSYAVHWLAVLLVSAPTLTQKSGSG